MRASSSKRSEPWRGAPLPFYAGVFLVSGCVLTLQIIGTRIISVTSWYYLAFFVISMAMFGLTAGAVFVFLRPERYGREQAPQRLARGTSWLALSIAGSLMAQLSLADALVSSLTTVVTYLLLALALAVPYFFAGIVISLALTRSPYRVSVVYGVDLLGAGLGCIAALFLLNATDGPSAMLWVAVAAAVGAACFGVHARAAGGAGRPLRSVLLIGAPLLVLAVFNSASEFRMRPLLVKGAVEDLSNVDFVGWNSFSRVAATKPFMAPPALWGASKPEVSQVRVPQVYLNIDGDAGTTMFRYADREARNLAFLSYDVTNLAHALPGRDKAAVIGVGGGRDVLSAKLSGKREVVGLEVNPIFVELLTGDNEFAKFAGLRDLEGVRFVVDEARSWLARTEERFDLVQMSLTDTWAATGAGAFTLSENGLYTLEAWRTILERLEPEGVFTVSRWYHPDHPYETGRLLALAVAALIDREVDRPEAHLVLAVSRPQQQQQLGGVVTLVLKSTPLSPDELRQLAQFASSRGHEVLLSPGKRPSATLLAAIVAARDQPSLNRVTAEQALEFRVPTDNWPFFFNHVRLDRPGEITDRIPLLGRYEPNAILGGVIVGNLLALVSLAVILAVSLVLVVTAIVLPLRLSAEPVAAPLVGWGTGYFLLIGVGFMLAEIALLQRSSVFLGHPSYSLSVVLATMVMATGLGSLLSGRLRLGTQGRAALWALVTGGYLILLPWLVASLFAAFDGAALALRVAVVVSLIVPAGVLMGFAFPTGIALVRAVDDRPTPWLWGVNGAAGVLAGGLAVVSSMALGIGATLVLAGLCYAGLTPALLGLLRLRGR